MIRHQAAARLFRKDCILSEVSPNRKLSIYNRWPPKDATTTTITMFIIIKRAQRGLILPPSLLVQPNKLTLIIPDRENKVQPSIHQRPPAKGPIENITAIPGARLQALDLKRRRHRLDGSFLLVSEHEGLRLVFADELHRGPVAVVRQAEPVEAACDYDGVHLGPVGEDSWDGGCFFGG